MQMILSKATYKLKQKYTWLHSLILNALAPVSRLWKHGRPLPGQKTYSIYIVSKLLAGEERLYKQGSGCP